MKTNFFSVLSKLVTALPYIAPKVSTLATLIQSSLDLYNATVNASSVESVITSLNRSAFAVSEWLNLSSFRNVYELINSTTTQFMNSTLAEAVDLLNLTSTDLKNMTSNFHKELIAYTKSDNAYLLLGLLIAFLLILIVCVVIMYSQSNFNRRLD